MPITYAIDDRQVGEKIVSDNISGKNMLFYFSFSICLWRWRSVYYFKVNNELTHSCV